MSPASSPSPIGQTQSVAPPDRQRSLEALHGDTFARLLDFLNSLDAAHIRYSLLHTRPDSVMIDVAVPGCRWEIEFMSDGSIEVERYQSAGDIETDEVILDDLLREFGDG